MWKLLKHGDVDVEYGGDKLRVAAAIIADFVRVEPNAVDVLAGWLERYPGGEWYRDKIAKKGRMRAQRELEGLYERTIAKLHPAITSRVDAQVLLGELRDIATRVVFGGRSGEARKRILLAHISVALKVGKLTYDISVRDLAKAAGVHHNTVLRHHPFLLKELGVPRLVESGAGLRASTYALSARSAEQLGTYVLHGEDDVYVTSSAAQALLHVGTRHGAAVHGTTYTVLDQDDAKTAADIADKTGASVHTTRSRLRGMASAGLATSIDGAWLLVNPSGLDAHAEAKGLTERERLYHMRVKADQKLHRFAFGQFVAQVHAEPSTAAHEATAVVTGMAQVGSYRVDMLTGEVSETTPESSTVFDLEPVVMPRPHIPEVEVDMPGSEVPTMVRVVNASGWSSWGAPTSTQS